MTKTLEIPLHRSKHLWRAFWAPDGYPPISGEKLPFAPGERADRLWAVPLEDGLVVLQTEDYDYRGDRRRHYVVRGDNLVDIERHEAEDLLDPAGAAERAEARADHSLAASYWRSHGPRPAGMMPGLYEARDGSVRMCLKVSARTYWHRPATPRETALFRARETVTPSP